MDFKIPATLPSEGFKVPVTEVFGTINRAVFVDLIIFEDKLVWKSQVVGTLGDLPYSTIKNISMQNALIQRIVWLNRGWFKTIGFGIQDKEVIKEFLLFLKRKNVPLANNALDFLKKN